MSQHLNTEHSYSVMKKKVGKVNYVILRLLEIMTNLLLTSLEDRLPFKHFGRDRTFKLQRFKQACSVT